MADVPQAQCPRCKEWQDDYDGFGVITCVCGYCSHPALVHNRCELCGQPDDLPPQPGAK